MGNKLTITNIKNYNTTLQDGNIYEVDFQFEGKNRPYFIVIPQAHWKDSNDLTAHGRPAVLLLHGGGGNANQILEQKADLINLSTQMGFTLIAPNGSGPLTDKLLTWNCFHQMCGYAAKNNTNDVEYIVNVLNVCLQQTPINPRRIYCTGFSNGGMMCYRLATDPIASKMIAAIAPIAGGVCYPPTNQMIGNRKGFEAKRAISVMHIHSVDDNRALYNGGLGPPFPMTNVRTPHHSVVDTIHQWIHFNGCDEKGEEFAPIVVKQKDGSSHSATQFIYRNGRDNTEVIHWRLTGAKHVWPTDRDDVAHSRFASHYCGTPSVLIDFNSIILNFFLSHTLPATPSTSSSPSSHLLSPPLSHSNQNIQSNNANQFQSISSQSNSINQSNNQLQPPIPHRPPPQIPPNTLPYSFNQTPPSLSYPIQTTPFHPPPSYYQPNPNFSQSSSQFNPNFNPNLYQQNIPFNQPNPFVQTPIQNYPPQYPSQYPHQYPPQLPPRSN